MCFASVSLCLCVSVSLCLCAHESTCLRVCASAWFWLYGFADGRAQVPALAMQKPLYSAKPSKRLRTCRISA